MVNPKLYCTNCSYQFVPKTGKVPSACPYCSKVGTVEKADQMQDLIDEVSHRDTEKEKGNKY